jgi:hypothetical protein
MCQCQCNQQSDANGVLAAFTLILNTLVRMEENMATEAEQLAVLSASVDDLIADVRAALAILVADQANFSPEGQAAFDALTAKVAAFDAEVGDADGSDTPAPEPEPVA